jgi:alkylation response protein AidB-like acyl-CoA dehydrogenase
VLPAVTSDLLAVLDEAVAESERRPPRLVDGRVEFDEAYHRAGRAVWATGIVGAGAVEQAALFYEIAQAGEGGHACPVVCTAGLVRALRTQASDKLRERFLPPLLEADYDRAQRGAQFLTERHGGSDVGANRVEAVPDGGGWRLHGEKWFCSVADADQFLVTARPRGAPDGTRGIGCFLVASADGGFRIRKLKDKLGTRALATGEIEFEGAAAYPLGPLEEGFRIAVSVLNTSRWLNAVGSSGLMRRAWRVASDFAAEREAFGQVIAEFPLVRENLAVIKSETEAAAASTAELTALVDRIDRGEATEEDVAWHRVLVNANKFVTSLAATKVARRAIETLGGNGTIEDFSPLPRLYRDSIVFESWEGAHNVLCAQVLRDLARFGAVDLAIERATAPPEVAAGLRRAVSDPEWGALHGRRQLDRLVRAVQVAALRESEPASAELLERRHLTPGWQPEADPDYPDLIERTLAK